MTTQSINEFSQQKLLQLLKKACIKESIYWNEKTLYEDANNQHVVNSADRNEMAIYLCEICIREDIQFSLETFALTCSLLDRFLCKYKVKAKYLECVAVACFYIACKCKEDDDKIAITSDFLTECNSRCSAAELLRMEMTVLTKFDWSVDDITSADFLYLFYALAGGVESKLSLRKLECELMQCLCISELTHTYSPSLLAFALISKHLQQHKAVYESLLNFLKRYARLGEQALMECQRQITLFLSASSTAPVNNHADLIMLMEMASANQIPLSSTVNNTLSSIKEEDEEELISMEQDNIMPVAFAADRQKHHFLSQMACSSSGMSYADIIAGIKSDHKRKLIEEDDNMENNFSNYPIY